MNKMIIGFFLAVLLSTVQAAEMDHSKMNHQSMAHDKKPGSPDLKKLAMVPASGKAREGGADGRYMMESIMGSDSLASRCAKASRGLMMLDNATWTKCGGKPQGVPVTPASLVLNPSVLKKETPKLNGVGNEHAGHHMP